MMFTDEQKTALSAPLNKAYVRDRKQGYGNVSYIEGWRVIDEANRIFGFDGWHREMIECRCVSDRERKIGNGKSGWGVTYTARVRVTVGDVVRDGCGAGHGIDIDVGQAHESAIKEAETDAMKRALMTFGNPFGLALYDKTQANVAEEPKPKPSSEDARKKALAWCEDFRTACAGKEPDYIDAMWKAHAKFLTRLQEAYPDLYKDLHTDIMSALAQ